MPGCRPVAERTRDEGCWILADQPLSTVSEPVFWLLDVYPDKGSALKAKGADDTVIEALGRVWVMSIGGAGGTIGPSAKRMATVGPLPIKPERKYSAQYMEAIFTPGMLAKTHVHSGAEAFYTEEGETCLETPDKVQVGKKGVSIIVPEGLPMELVATGSETRKGIVLILHDATQPPTTIVEWKSKGLCKAEAK